ncbi:MAG TPA: transposase [Elusimicrobiales bacterium]|nr:transposase [Elusimicrobiales bacterium]
MYRSEKFNPSLFGKLFHLGGKLSPANRWLKLAEVLPWGKLDEAYGRYFSAGYGRPARDSRLVCGLLAVKQLKNVSDEDAVAEFMESPYIQAFCGQEYFALENVVNPGMLSERRKRLGTEFLALLEAELAAALKADKDLRFHPARNSAPEVCFFCSLTEKVRALFAK